MTLLFWSLAWIMVVDIAIGVGFLIYLHVANRPIPHNVLGFWLGWTWGTSAAYAVASTVRMLHG